MARKYYITTTLPYVNAAPHLGFALEIVQADVLARYMSQKGADVVFNTGTDEHGAKIYERAVEEKKDPQAYVDEYASKFEKLKDSLGLSYTNFTRTTDPHHKLAAQEFWKRCVEKGDIEKGFYSVKYCVGCELEKTDSELKDGRCEMHPNLSLETIEEENYFFKFSRYQEKLLALYKGHPDFVLPDYRLNEIRQFVERGLTDFSVSRLKSKMPWGVPVPGDEKHVMYVWFDALVNYISTLGWPENVKRFEEFWPGVQIAGKDNLRQQSAMWQAMLMSAGLPTSKQVLIHGFITTDGKKISKSLGNTVDPLELVRKYGTDAVRYYLLREIPSSEDGDFTEAKFHDRYNGDLANGLGNFVARVLALGEKMGKMQMTSVVQGEMEKKARETSEKISYNIQNFKIHDALAAIWEFVSVGDEYVNTVEPWKTMDRKVIYNLVVMVDNIAAFLEPFLPETAGRIKKAFVWEGDEFEVKKIESLFERLK